jgi:hypothetical protein
MPIIAQYGDARWYHVSYFEVMSIVLQNRNAMCNGRHDKATAAAEQRGQPLGSDQQNSLLRPIQKPHAFNNMVSCFDVHVHETRNSNNAYSNE